jgi:hypothetical protein
MSRHAIILYLLSLSSLAGCGATVRSAASEGSRAAVPIVIDESVKSMEDAAMRERIARVMGTPEMQQVIRQIAASATAGALDEAATGRESDRLARVGGTVTKAISRALVQVITEEVVTEPNYRVAWQKFEDGVSHTTTLATKAALRAAAEEIPHTLGPAIGNSLATELESPELRTALSTAVADSTKAALSGVRQQIIEIREPKKPGKPPPTLMQRLGNALMEAWLIAFLLGAGVIALIAWAIHGRQRANRYHTALLGLVSKQNGAEGEGTAEDRVRTLVEALGK